MTKIYLYLLSAFLFIFACTLYAHTDNPSETWMQDIWNDVRHLDKNNDGKITRKEYTVYWEEMYKFADVNKDGTISELEWRLVLEGKRFSAVETHRADINKDDYISASEAQECWKERFGEADINRDGKLSKIEARSLLETHLMGVYGEDYNILFNLQRFIDVNNDGRMSPKEFQDFWAGEHEEADLNNDGKVSRYEYRAMMESKRMLHDSL